LSIAQIFAPESVVLAGCRKMSSYLVATSSTSSLVLLIRWRRPPFYDGGHILDTSNKRIQKWVVQKLFQASVMVFGKWSTQQSLAYSVQDDPTDVVQIFLQDEATKLARRANQNMPLRTT
jgi:hypothetical protein